MKLFFGVILLIGLLTAVPVRAQFVVVDPANLVENTLTAIQTLEQLNNQIQQLANEAVMLENEAQPLDGPAAAG